MIKRLIDTLNKETELYKELLSLLQEERRLLSRRRGEELQRIASKIESLVFKIKGVEDARRGCVEAIGENLGIGEDGGDGIRLSRIIDSIEQPYRSILKQIQSNLLSITGSIKELNMENGIVIKRGMDYIQSAFLFLREMSTFETYKPTGRMR